LFCRSRFDDSLSKFKFILSPEHYNKCMLEDIFQQLIAWYTHNDEASLLALHMEQLRGLKANVSQKETDLVNNGNVFCNADSDYTDGRAFSQDSVSLLKSMTLRDCVIDEPSEDSPQFKVTTKNQTFCFSNRSSTRGELRGAKLRELIKQYQHDHPDKTLWDALLMSQSDPAYSIGYYSYRAQIPTILCLNWYELAKYQEDYRENPPLVNQFISLLDKVTERALATFTTPEQITGPALLSLFKQIFVEYFWRLQGVSVELALSALDAPQGPYVEDNEDEPDLAEVVVPKPLPTHCAPSSSPLAGVIDHYESFDPKHVSIVSTGRDDSEIFHNASS